MYIRLKIMYTSLLMYCDCIDYYILIWNTNYKHIILLNLQFIETEILEISAAVWNESTHFYYVSSQHCRTIFKHSSVMIPIARLMHECPWDYRETCKFAYGGRSLSSPLIAAMLELSFYKYDKLYRRCSLLRLFFTCANVINFVMNTYVFALTRNHLSR